MSAVSPRDGHFMSLAIAEARKSIPIPSAYCVGCVVTRDDQVISTGYSRELPGNTHAEQVALMKINYDAYGTTLYTTMEPCSERISGNVTCVETCIRSCVGRVVVGVLEPKNFVECKGIQQLATAGIRVNVLEGFEKKCLEPNFHIVASI